MNGLTLAEREKNRAFLASKVGQLDGPARQGRRGALHQAVVRSVAAARTSASSRRELEKEGIQSELRNDSVPGIGKVLSFLDNKGTTIELFSEWSYLGRHEQVLGAGPLKLGHVAFVVRDPAGDGGVL